MDARAGDPPFGRIGIAGLGLIGGSIAAGVRAAWPSAKICGVDRPEVLAEATSRGLIDQPMRAIDELAGVELVVLAAPVPQILDDLLPAVRGLGPRTLVTDVGSTKRRILEAAASAGLTNFVGGHPIAGTERPGLEHARADLFAGQPWLLVPAATTPAAAIDALEQFVRGLGARPERIDADTHDRVMAYVSHLPQLLSVALMNTAGGAIGEAGLARCGRAFIEMTRLAASPADLWEGILATNADYVAQAAAALAAALPTGAARPGMNAWIASTFQQSGEWRKILMSSRSDT